MTSNLDLDQRQGWPEELRLLLEQHPRDTWSERDGAGLARFWLDRHDGFRRQVDTLRAASTDHLEGRVAADEHRRWLAPRLQAFLSHLLGHHQIEDHHYFPVFRAADTRLARGFEVLDRDHHVLHESIIEIVGAANEFLAAAETDALRRTGERYATLAERLRMRLLRHLEDEEDLIIPVMLEHGG